jgi:hypothetical protein
MESHNNQHLLPPSTDSQASEEWITSSDLENCDFASTGKNSYFILEPGFQARFRLADQSESGKRSTISTVDLLLVRVQSE